MQISVSVNVGPFTSLVGELQEGQKLNLSKERVKATASCPLSARPWPSSIPLGAGVGAHGARQSRLGSLHWNGQDTGSADSASLSG